MLVHLRLQFHITFSCTVAQWCVPTSSIPLADSITALQHVCYAIHLMFTVSHNEQMWSPKKNSWNCCEPQRCKCGQQLPCLEFQTSLADFSFLHVFPYNVSDNPHQSHLHYYLTVSTETLKNSLIQSSDLLLIIDKREK